MVVTSWAIFGNPRCPNRPQSYYFLCSEPISRLKFMTSVANILNVCAIHHERKNTPMTKTALRDDVRRGVNPVPVIAKRC